MFATVNRRRSEMRTLLALGNRCRRKPAHPTLTAPVAPRPVLRILQSLMPVNAPAFATLVAHIRRASEARGQVQSSVPAHALTREVGAPGQSYDDDIVFAAVWLHDHLGRVRRPSSRRTSVLAKWDCVAYAINKHRTLSRFGSQQKIPPSLKPFARISHGKPHHHRGTILTATPWIFCLELVGAVIVLRTVCKIGRDTRFHLSRCAAGASRTSSLPNQLKLPAAPSFMSRLKATQFLKAAEAEGCLQNNGPVVREFTEPHWINRMASKRSRHYWC